MQHTKTFILSLDEKDALDRIYREIESLEDKLNDIEYRLRVVENGRR